MSKEDWEVTPTRSLRVPNEVWDRAQAKAKSEGVTMSTVIRRLLSVYGRN